MRRSGTGVGTTVVVVVGLGKDVASLDRSDESARESDCFHCWYFIILVIRGSEGDHIIPTSNVLPLKNLTD